jgi:hypothetical protein
LRSGGVVATTCALLIAGCGGDAPRQDKDEPSRAYDVEIVKASFPKRQSLAERARMRITVRNADDATIPNIAVTLTSDDAEGGGGFVSQSDQAGLAEPTKTLWIVDSEPRGGGTAYVSTWALGPLRAGQTRSFTWDVTPMVAGAHTIRYRVAAGLAGKAKAQTTRGDEAAGVFKVDVSRKPPQGSVDLESGEVKNQ